VTKKPHCINFTERQSERQTAHFLLGKMSRLIGTYYKYGAVKVDIVLCKDLPVFLAFKKLAIGSNLQLEPHLGVYDGLQFFHDGIQL